MLFRLGDIFIVLLLAILSWQDFRSRLISWWLIPLLLTAFVFTGKEQLSWMEIGKLFLFNLIFLGIQFLLVWTVMSFRKRKFIQMNEQIGIGDVLFLICLAAAFSTINFFIFYTIVLLIVLLISIPVKLFRSSEKMLIPLAGAIAVPMIVLILFRLFDPKINFYSEEWLANFLTVNLIR